MTASNVGNGGMNISREMYNTLFKSDYAKYLVQKALDDHPEDDDAMLEQLQSELTRAAEADGKVTDDEKSLMNALTSAGMFGFGTSKEIVKANLKEILKVHQAEANQVKFADKEIHLQTQEGWFGGWGGAQDRTLTLLDDFDTPAPKPPSQPAEPVAPPLVPAVEAPPSSAAEPAPPAEPASVAPEPGSAVAPPVNETAAAPPVALEKRKQVDAEVAAAQKPVNQLKLDALPAEQRQAILTQANNAAEAPKTLKALDQDLQRAHMWTIDDISSACKDIDKVLNIIEANRAAYGNPDTKALRAQLNSIGSFKTTKNADGSLDTSFTLKHVPPGPAELTALNQLKTGLKALQADQIAGADPLAEGGALQTTVTSLIKSNPALKNDPAIQLAQQQPQLLKYADLLSTLNKPENKPLLDAILRGDSATAETYLSQYNQSFADKYCSFPNLSYNNLFDFEPPVFGYGFDDSLAATSGLFDPASVQLDNPLLTTLGGVAADAGSLAGDFVPDASGYVLNLPGIGAGSRTDTSRSMLALDLTSVTASQFTTVDLNTRLSFASPPLKPGETMQLAGVNQSDVASLIQLLQNQPGAKEALAAQNNDLSGLLKTTQGQRLKGTLDLSRNLDRLVADGSYLDLATGELQDDIGKTANAQASLELTATAVEQALHQPGISSEVKTYLTTQQGALKDAIAKVRAGQPIDKSKLDEDLLAKAAEVRKSGGLLTDEVLRHASLKPRMEVYDPLFDRLRQSLTNGEMEQLVAKLPEPQKTQLNKLFLETIPTANNQKTARGNVYLAQLKESIDKGQFPPEADFMLQGYLQNIAGLLDKAQDGTVDAAQLAAYGRTQGKGPIPGSPFELLDDTNRFNNYAIQLMKSTGNPELVKTAMQEFFKSSSQNLKSTLGSPTVDRQALYEQLDMNFARIQGQSFLAASFGPAPTAPSGALPALQLDGPAQPLLAGISGLAAADPAIAGNGVLKNLKPEQLMQLATARTTQECRDLLGYKGRQTDEEVLGLQIKAMEAVERGIHAKLDPLSSATNLSPDGRAVVRELTQLADGFHQRIEGTRRLQRTYGQQARLEGKTDTQLFRSGYDEMKKLTQLPDQVFEQVFGVNTAGGFNAELAGQRLIDDMNMNEETFTRKMRDAGSTVPDADMHATYMAFHTASMQAAGAYTSNITGGMPGTWPQQRQNARAMALLMDAHASGEIQLSDETIDELSRTYQNHPEQFLALAQQAARSAAKDPQSTPTANALDTMAAGASPAVPAAGAPGAPGAPAAGFLAASLPGQETAEPALAAPGEAVQPAGADPDAPLDNPGRWLNQTFGMFTSEQLPPHLRWLSEGFANGKFNENDFSEGPSRGGKRHFHFRGAGGLPPRDFEIDVGNPRAMLERFNASLPSAFREGARQINAASPQDRERLTTMLAPMQQHNAATMTDYGREMAEITHERAAAQAQIAAADQRINDAMNQLNQIYARNPGVQQEIDQADPHLSQAAQADVDQANRLEAGSSLAPAPAISGDELFEKWLSETLGIIRNWDEATRKLVLAQIAKQMMNQVINTFYKDKADEASDYHNRKLGEMNKASKQRDQSLQARSRLDKAASGQGVSALSGDTRAADRGAAFNLEALRKVGVKGIREQLADQLRQARQGQPPLQISPAEVQSLLARFDAIVAAGGTETTADDRQTVDDLRGSLLHNIN